MDIESLYGRILKDLNLKSEDVPLLVGELVGKDQGGLCYEHNEVLKNLHYAIPTSYIINHFKPLSVAFSSLVYDLFTTEKKYIAPKLFKKKLVN